METELTLIDVSYPAAAQLGQTVWLSTCDAHYYAHTRAWGAWLRTVVPSHAGLSWHSKRNPARRSYVFYERDVASEFTAVKSIQLHKGEGLKLVKAVMLEHNAIFK